MEEEWAWEGKDKVGATLSLRFQLLIKFFTFYKRSSISFVTVNYQAPPTALKQPQGHGTQHLYLRRPGVLQLWLVGGISENLLEFSN